MTGSKRTLLLVTLLGLAFHIATSRGAELSRQLPQPLASHPGNIFLTGENVVVAAPPGEVNTWRMHNYDDEVIAKGEIKNGEIDLGKLPVGYYKIVRGAPGQFTNRTYIGVLEPLRAPTPLTSPIAIDVAMAWFWPNSESNMRAVANLCQLAGINRVRDRLLWGELEPERGKFATNTRYDVSEKIQHEAGLQILQVCHVSAPWANANPKRFPEDLRDVYNFYRELARRWTNEVQAFEPWNEAEIEMFGGHTGSEMASLQKAAFLGLKAGNPTVIACQNVFAIHRATTLADFNDNKAWPYFDTYNLHHYEKLENYPQLYADHRTVSAGKPIWVSECSVHVKWHNEQFKELSEGTMRLQSENLTKTYALALHENAQAVFYFMLPHYTEYRLQYGLLHPDLTPRAGYVALAAVGRLLADAKPLGRLKTKEDFVHAYLFDAKPDGAESKVLVAWSTNETTFALPKLPESSYDHLGRAQKIESKTVKLTNAPLYFVFPKKTSFDLTPPPKAPRLLTDQPAHVVLQAVFPEKEIDFQESAYKIARGEMKTVPIFLYNFGAKKLSGKLRLNVPAGWTADLPAKTQIAPGERKELPLKLTAASDVVGEAQIEIKGDFGAGEKPVLSFHITPATNN